MGEMADYMLMGDDCQSCGEYLGDGDGYPRNCRSCEAELQKEKRQKKKKEEK